MQKYRLLFSYLITAIIYASIFEIISYSPSSLLVAKEQNKEKKIALSLSAFVPEVLNTPKTIKKTPQKALKKAPKALIKEKILNIPKAKPLKKVEKKKIKKIKKKNIKNIKNIKKKQKKIYHKKTSSKKSLAKKALRKQHKSSKAQKNRFLSKIRYKINANKSYPRIAQKRQMQGSVKVSFTILRSGAVGNITLSGKRVFFASAKEAVKSAFPISTKNAPISLPLHISITLHYRIR